MQSANLKSAGDIKKNKICSQISWEKSIAGREINDLEKKTSFYFEAFVLKTDQHKI